MTLNPKQARFAQEYIIDLNATQAAVRAGYSAKTAYSQGERLLKHAEVRAEIGRLQAKIGERLEISAENVVQRWWEIATADPNDLIQFRRRCCRYCYGEGHAYQWRDANEFAAALAAASAAKDKKGDLVAAANEAGLGDWLGFGELPPALPTDEGGYGFRRDREPVSTCTNCDGEGMVDVHAADTRKLSGAARVLYAGVKQTRDGFEIKMQDQGKALDNVARYLGLFKDKVEVTVTDRAAALAAARKRAADAKR
ncbi:terminase small subunit [Sphingomonas koreensis]|uniref:Terminase small subunit n=1 Tax=Sphingomonas koreensis TaxID=93064 RepID=A0A430G2D9_9SPHN|nr:terminase small subunit [Sphingomonas koreensis]RSY83129.1 terminase small subunit [Sphingomonas koreensis]